MPAMLDVSYYSNAYLVLDLMGLPFSYLEGEV